VKTVVNAAPPFSEPPAKQMYPLCDILCLNETEATVMTGLSINSIEDGKVTCRELLGRGCGSVILTMGENGAIFMDQNSIFHIPVPDQIIPVDTTVRIKLYCA